MSIMEACSFGIPVIATDVGGTSEIVRGGETGYLLPADFAPEDLAKLLRRQFLAEPEAHERLRSNCRRVWQETFSADVNFARFAQELAPQEKPIL